MPAGLGLKNLRERLKLQFNEKALFNITQQGNIVSATLLMPVQ
jgi:sensor histidine kinase YesM